MHGGRRGGARQRRAAMIGLAVLSLLATACGNDADEGTRDVPEMTQAQGATTTVSEPTGATDGPGVDGRTVRIVLRFDSGASESAIDAMVDIVRRRLDAAGVDEPELSADGERLHVVLHGVSSAQEASMVRLLSRPGTVRIRPVLSFTINTGSAQVDTSVTDPQGPVQLSSADGTLLYSLGPAGADGTIFEPDASAEMQNEHWTVVVGLRPGAAGEDPWNALAAQCYSGTMTCPPAPADDRGQLAIEVDGVVISAPTVNAPEFAGEVSIVGQFSEDDAKELAAFLRSGALTAVTVESVTTD